MALCSSCQFHNMPGTSQCGRCGASLLLATALINVYPPRASCWAKTWRKTTCWRIWYRLGRTYSVAARRLHLDIPSGWPGILPMLFLLVPGWPQLATSKLALGRSLLGAYVVFGLLGAALYGTAVGLFWQQAAIVVHAIGLYDVAQSACKVRGDRLLRFFLGCGFVSIVLYLPLFYYLPQFAAPIAMQLDRGPLLAGDVLLINRNAYRWATPRAGDIVEYEIAPAQIQVRRNVITLLTGRRVDRVLATSNQTVAWDGKTLTVNGLTSTNRPLNTVFSPRPFSLTVPADHYFIFPGGDGVEIPNIQSVLFRVSVVPLSRIQGQAYWRHFPWSRMGPIR